MSVPYHLLLIMAKWKGIEINLIFHLRPRNLAKMEAAVVFRFTPFTTWLLNFMTSLDGGICMLRPFQSPSTRLIEALWFNGWYDRTLKLGGYSLNLHDPVSFWAAASFVIKEEQKYIYIFMIGFNWNSDSKLRRKWGLSPFQEWMMKEE